MFKMSFLRWKEEGEVVKKTQCHLQKEQMPEVKYECASTSSQIIVGWKIIIKKKWNSFPNKSEKDSKVGTNQYHPVINRKC